MNTKQLMAAMALTALTITACKKDSEEPAPPTVSTTANVSLEFRFVNGENGYTLDTLLADSLGHAIKVSSAKFYVSAIHAENDDDVIVGDWDDAFLLVDASATTNTFSIGTMSAPAHIHQFHFDIGLDSTTNHADPTLAEAPLNDATMHWAWNTAAGYKFLLLEGRVDDDGDGVVDGSDPEFVYHCATDALLSEAHAHQHHDVTSGENYSAPVLVNMALLFAGIDVVATPNAMGGEAVNVRVISNLAGAIDGEE